MDNGGEPLPEPDKRPTDKVGQLSKGLRMELDLADPEAVAEFLEAVAASVRKKRRIVLTIE